MKNRVIYYIARIISIIPLNVLYILSDIFLYPLVYYIIRYRLRVTRKNLKNSFPQKSEVWLRKTEKKFYRHFCDMFVETIAVLNMSSKEASKRMVCENPEILGPLLKNNKGVLALFGHYGNWEYISLLCDLFDHGRNPRIYMVYRPLNSKNFDYLYYRIRTRFGGYVLAKNDTYRKILELKRDGIPVFVGLNSDQTPSKRNIHYWKKFLNQDTPFLTGPERIAKKTGFAVIYCSLTCEKRGYYKINLKLITDDPKSMDDNEITAAYADNIENTILKEPSHWLWTHKRWKHKHIVDSSK